MFKVCQVRLFGSCASVGRNSKITIVSGTCLGTGIVRLAVVVTGWVSFAAVALLMLSGITRAIRQGFCENLTHVLGAPQHICDISGPLPDRCIVGGSGLSATSGTVPPV